MFNIGVINTVTSCHMPFWPSKFFVLFFGHFTKMCFAKVSLVIVKASSKISCHIKLWLQFTNRNIVGLQSWRFSRHFQIPITPAILTLQLGLSIDWQAQLCVNVDFPNIIGWRVIVEITWNLNYWMDWYKCHCAVFRWTICIELEVLTLGNRPKTGGLCLWSWMMINCIMYGT